MEFNPNKTPVKVIKEGGFGVYSSVNGNWYKESWKEFNQWKYIDQKFYCSDNYDVSVNRYDDAENH